MNPNPISSLYSCAFIFFMTSGRSLRLGGLAGSPASCGLPAGAQAAAPGTADLAAPPSHGRPMRPAAVEDPGHCTIHDDEAPSTVLRCIKFTGGLYLESVRGVSWFLDLVKDDRGQGFCCFALIDCFMPWFDFRTRTVIWV